MARVGDKFLISGHTFIIAEPTSRSVVLIDVESGYALLMPQLVLQDLLEDLLAYTKVNLLALL
jgi:hypothetical protein